MTLTEAMEVGRQALDRYNINHFDLIEAEDGEYHPQLRVTLEQFRADVSHAQCAAVNPDTRVATMAGYTSMAVQLVAEVPWVGMTADLLVGLPCTCVGPVEVHVRNSRLCPVNGLGHRRGLVDRGDGHIDLIEVRPDGSIVLSHACELGARRCGRYNSSAVPWN